MENARTDQGLPCGLEHTQSVKLEQWKARVGLDGKWRLDTWAAIRDRETEEGTSLERGHYTQIPSSVAR